MAGRRGPSRAGGWQPPYRKPWWSRPLSRRALALWALAWAASDYLDVVERWLP